MVHAEPGESTMKHIQKITVAKAQTNLFGCIEFFVEEITFAFSELFACLFGKDCNDEPTS
jgi:hypothetical protein